MPEFILTAVLAPVLSGLIVEFIKMRFGRREESATVKTAITLNDETTGRSVRIEYDGPSSEFEKTMVSAAKQLKSGDVPPEFHEP